MPYMRASGEVRKKDWCMKLVPTNPTQPVNDLLNGGRTRIRTRVAGLEGQSDIRLHYTSKSGQKHLFHEL